MSHRLLERQATTAPATARDRSHASLYYLRASHSAAAVIGSRSARPDRAPVLLVRCPRAATFSGTRSHLRVRVRVQPILSRLRPPSAQGNAHPRRPTRDRRTLYPALTQSGSPTAASPTHRRGHHIEFPPVPCPLPNPRRCTTDVLFASTDARHAATERCTRSFPSSAAVHASSCSPCPLRVAHCTTPTTTYDAAQT
ncbi:hypothetical protein DAEQUDRAFT_528138 [Daedalea quercina L-15889]|uniref:Uncharacterized protein n=1 Tax=Daedalea quercina L-15889 TaxID=1314783 RepID=A0A165MA02_9APHY|nr:hypothetical protein DAEQUDRAFT_528138 [Daedalea quercina L-15889]